MKNKILWTSVACLGLGMLPAVSAQAGNDPFIGEITMTGATFCPRGTANLDGQLLSIANNTALFSLLGTTYGGDGRTSFGLPDMRGRSPIHTGRGPGLTAISQGARGGTETSKLKSVGQSASKNASGANVASADQPVANRDPYLAIRYCIATQGTYPSRS